jgi:hypothetical protein
VAIPSPSSSFGIRITTQFSSSRKPTLPLSKAVPDRVVERAVLASYPPSTNGNCGPQTDGSTVSCAGSTFGSCCSQNGYCGNTDPYCGAGCKPQYGTCNSVSSSPSPSPSPSSVVTSPDGSCAGANGYSCIGFALGSCCSSSNYCGSTDAYCGAGCNPAYGTCGTSNSVSSSPSPSASTISSTRTSSVPSGTPTGRPSVDGSCGGTNGYNCVGSTFGNCCSSSGYCGSTTAYWNWM